MKSPSSQSPVPDDTSHSARPAARAACPSGWHPAFEAALAAMSPTSPAWQLTAAGLEALRLAKRWRDETRALAATDPEVMGVRARLALAPAHPVRALVTAVVDAVTRYPQTRVILVAPRLVAYGRALEGFADDLALAADVYRTVLRLLPETDDAELVMDVELRLGACARQLGDARAAADWYRAARERAERHGDAHRRCRAALGEWQLVGDVAATRDAAARALDALVSETLALPDAGALVADVCHARAELAMAVGDAERAVVCLGLALERAELPAKRLRMLTALGAALVQLRCYDAAADAYRTVCATTTDAVLRQRTRIELLGAVVRAGHLREAEAIAAELDLRRLTPPDAALAWYYLGQAALGRDHATDAWRAFERAARLAEQHGLEALGIRAEVALDAVRHGRTRRAGRERAMRPPAAVTPVIETVRALAAITR